MFNINYGVFSFYKAKHYVIMKIPNKRELQQIAFNHSPDIAFDEFTEIYKRI